MPQTMKFDQARDQELDRYDDEYESCVGRRPTGYAPLVEAVEFEQLVIEANREIAAMQVATEIVRSSR